MKRLILLFLSLFVFSACITEDYTITKEDIYGTWNVTQVVMDDGGIEYVVSQDDVLADDALYHRMVIGDCYVRFYNSDEETPCAYFYYGTALDNLYLYEVDDSLWEHPIVWRIDSLSNLVLVLTKVDDGYKITYRFERVSEEETTDED